MLRFFIGLCTVIGAFMFPWWTPLVFAVYGTFRYPRFFEALIAGLIIDVQYGTHTVLGIPGIATLSALALLGVMRFVRRHIRYEAFPS